MMEGREGVRGDGGRERGREGGKRGGGERYDTKEQLGLIIIQHTSIVSIIKIRLSNINDLFNPIHLPLVLFL